MEADMDGSGMLSGAAGGSLLGPIGSLAGAGLGLIGDLFNYGQQKKNVEYQKNLQQQIFAREDNAVQRRVADLRAAGLSPTLAAGSAAQVGPAIHTTAPQSGAGDRAAGAVSGAIGMQAAMIGLRKLSAEVGRTEADTRRTLADAKVREASVPWAPMREQNAAQEGLWRADKTKYDRNLSDLASQLVRKYGMSEHEGRLEALAQSNRKAKYEQDAAEQFYGGTAQGVKQWLPLVQALLSIISKGPTF